MSWLDYEQNGANTHLSDKLAQQSQSDVSSGAQNNKDIVNVLKLQLEEAQDHNNMIQDEMIKLKSQWEMLAREREDKLQSELQQRLVEATERLELEDKVEASWREIKRYQDTLAQSQEQLQSAQVMVEESHDRSVATHEKYVSVKRMLRKYEILYRLVTTQLQQRDESYKNYIKSLLSHNVVHTLPSLHRILKKQPVIKRLFRFIRERFRLQSFSPTNDQTREVLLLYAFSDNGIAQTKTMCRSLLRLLKL